MPELFPHSESHFERRTINKGSKERTVLVPDDETRAIHASMLSYFNDFNFIDTSRLPPTTFVSAGMPETSLLDNVLPHKDNWTFYKLDFKNAFPSVDTNVLKENLVQRARELGRGPAVLSYITLFMDEYATSNEVSGLPLGLPCSPYLFNFYLSPMDKELSDFCEARGYVYTRWLDDITISSPKKDKTLGADTRRAIRNIIELNSGMSINHAKSQLHYRAAMPVTVTGTSIYPDGRIQPKPKILENIDAIYSDIENLVYTGARMDATIVGVVDGHHSSLLSMSTEPLNETMKKAIDRYHVLARLVRAAIQMADEAETEPDPYRKEYIRNHIKMRAGNVYRKEHGFPYIENGKEVGPLLDEPPSNT